jgi:nitrogen fixation/metabolism regulation signal transduction histidine kinase
MTPQQQPTHDAAALQELGRASVEVVHDVKNQLNGLKLYATFLRKRAERDQRPADEIETVNKIIAGLERAAEEMNLLVRFGRTSELHRAPQDLAEIVRAAATAEGATFDAQGGDFRGEFDAERLGEAFGEINAAARANSKDQAHAPVSLRREETAGGAFAVVEWRGVKGEGARKVFGELDGVGSLRAALAARIIAAHGGAVEQIADVIRVRIPLKES